MKGQRVETIQQVIDGDPGSYMLTDARDAVWLKLPTGSLGHLPVTDGASHDDPPTWHLIEHEDGTITLEPSIRQLEIPGHVAAWHGHLQHGEFNES